MALSNACLHVNVYKQAYKLVFLVVLIRTKYSVVGKISNRKNFILRHIEPSACRLHTITTLSVGN